ncbi:MAG: ribosome small subunit-dependent GTPase A [Burkholderiaceae bacterium]|nr:ribosome small subunit-dependent GTPase A [Burkholderiaceae bacterium]
MATHTASKRQRAAVANQHFEQGLVTATFGRHVSVLCDDGVERLCHPRGKKNQAVVGDRIQWSLSADQGTIESVLPRRNLFFRQDDMRTKSFAANIDQIVVFLGAEPEYSDMQLSRALIAAQAEGISAIIVLNKHDLTDLFNRSWQRLKPYRDMGLTVLPLSLNAQAPFGMEALAPLLKNRASLVLGPSGAGKSTLINTLVPMATVHTQEISRALNSGKHTTTSTTWYWLDETHSAAIIDSPGFQEFGLHHIQPAELAKWMPDLAAHMGACKFHNCTHMHEPGCPVQTAVEDGGIDENRYRIYQELFDFLDNIPSYR